MFHVEQVYLVKQVYLVVKKKLLGIRLLSTIRVLVRSIGYFRTLFMYLIGYRWGVYGVFYTLSGIPAFLVYAIEGIAFREVVVIYLAFFAIGGFVNS